MYNLSKTRTLIDLNGTLANFKTSFTVTPTDNTIEYQASIVNQTVLDNGDEIKSRALKGPFTGDYENKDGVYQNYFLVLNSDQGVQVSVDINILPLDTNVQTQQNRQIGITSLENNIARQEEEAMKATTTSSGEDKNKRNTKYFLIFLVVLVGGFLLYYFWNKKEPAYKPLPPNSPVASALVASPAPSHTESPAVSPALSEPQSPLPRKFASRAAPFSFKPY